MPSDPDEGVIRQAIARAQELAKGFADLRRAPDRVGALKLPEFCKTPLTF
jgi:hypothetical protein